MPVTPENHLGVPLSLISWDQFDAWVTKTVGTRAPATVCTVAPSQAYLARRNAAYRSCLEGASVALVDGNGVRLALAAAGLGVDDRITGREGGERLYGGKLPPESGGEVMGSCPDGQQAVARERVDWLILGQQFEPVPDPESVARVAEDLRNGQVVLALVALGCPKGEQWADALCREYGCLYISVGGAVDTASGIRRKPPAWVTRTGMEWGWRAAQDPRLLPHVTRAALAMPVLLCRALLYRFTKAKRGPTDSG